MAKFWQKKYTSKYTGAEIDAAVGKAGNLPATTSADAGKALVVDENGKIVAGGAGIVDDTWVIEGNLSTMSITVKKVFETLEARTAYKDQIAANCLKGKTLYQATVKTSDIPVLPVGVKLTFNIVGTVGSSALGNTVEGPAIFGYGAILYTAALVDDSGVGNYGIKATFTLSLG